jgi:hypothetical protein
MASQITAAAATQRRKRTLARPSLAPIRGPYRRYLPAGLKWSTCIRQLIARLHLPRNPTDPYKCANPPSSPQPTRPHYLHSLRNRCILVLWRGGGLCWFSGRLEWGALGKVATSNKVNRKTLTSQWRVFVRLREGGMSQSEALQYVDRERRGGHNRLMTLPMERQWASDVAAAAHDGDAWTGAMALQHAHDAVATVHPYELRSSAPPLLTPSWLTHALSRHRLAFGKARFRDPQPPPDPVLVQAYRKQCQHWVDIVGPGLFFNLDEIAWRVSNPPRKVIGLIGQPRRVHALADIRHSFTGVFIANASGDKLPAVVVKAVKTDRGLHRELLAYGRRCVMVKGGSGWATTSVICTIIEKVIVPATRGRQAVLALDVAGAHGTAEVQACLARNNIIPIWVPPRGTGLYQPMDVSVMGVVRACARRLWQQYRRNRGWANHTPLTPFVAIGQLIDCWEQVSKETIVKGFKTGMAVFLRPTPSPPRMVIPLTRISGPVYSFRSFSGSSSGSLTVRLAVHRDSPQTPLYKIRTFPPPARVRHAPKKQKIKK